VYLEHEAELCPIDTARLFVLCDGAGGAGKYKNSRLSQESKKVRTPTYKKPTHPGEALYNSG